MTVTVSPGLRNPAFGDAAMVSAQVDLILNATRSARQGLVSTSSALETGSPPEERWMPRSGGTGISSSEAGSTATLGRTSTVEEECLPSLAANAWRTFSVAWKGRVRFGS